MATVRHKHQRRLASIPTQRGSERLVEAAVAPVESRPAAFVPAPRVDPLPPETAALLLPELAGLFVPTAEPLTAPAPTASPLPLRARPSVERPTTQPPATTPAQHEAPAATGPDGRRRTGTVVVSLAVVLVLVGTAGGIALHLDQQARAAELALMQERVGREVAAERADTAFLRGRQVEVATATRLASRSAEVADTDGLIAQARAVLDANPQAGDAPRAALQQAIDSLTAVSAALGQGTSAHELRAAGTTLAAPQQAVVEAQAAWQAAEDARIAAERAAAEAAAQAAAAKQRTRAPAATTTRTRATTTAPAESSDEAAAPVAGIDAYSAQAIGNAINTHRANNGLGALSISGSSTLQNHAVAMATEGRIWHSGKDSIVGWVQPVSASAMIDAYANSPAHNAWMLNADVTRMSIGAVTRDGRLYTAVLFS
ncbi:CAP domain-containing protein [Cellulomonas sp. P22]|uniref:CAP domain-containing protein n=1 Tax=Cellulomonas sp. P22 TaxID=3373189 RepID=UPI0037AD0A5E